MGTLIRSIAALAVLAAACADDRVEVTATPQSTPADGLGLVEVSARVVYGGLDAADGAEVSIAADAALLFASPEDAQPAVPGALAPGARELVAPVREGVARVWLRAPIAPQSVHIDARYTTPEGVDLGGGADVDFARPPPVSAGAEVDGDGNALAQFLFRCERRNLGALRVDRGDLAMPCEVVLRRHDGAPLPHTPVAFYAEAGHIADIAATADSPRAFVYVAPAALDRWPADVAPREDEEPFALEGAGPVPGAAERNPRDGLVTLLAVARGHEAYADLDGDGVYDPDEPFIDEGEPFLDVDDDGVHDPAVDGPLCCDSNGNGKVDGPNGRWDDDVYLGRVTYVVWSGDVAEGPGRSGVTPEEPSVPGLGSAELTVTLVDDDYNPVAADGDSDGLTVDPAGPVALFPPPDLELAGGAGIAIEDRFPRFVFEPGRSPVGALGDGNARAATVEVLDAREETCVDVEWALDVIARTTAGPLAPQQATRWVVRGAFDDRDLQCP